MSNADDYGRGRSELVPSGLRVYRHFKVTQDGMLAPTVISSGPFEPGVNAASCYAGYRGYRYNFYGPGTRYRIPRAACSDCGGTGRIVRRAPQSIDYVDYKSFLEGSFESYLSDYRLVEDHCPCVTEECKSPNVECNCGFYASYSPETNFFERQLCEAQRDRLNGVHRFTDGLYRNYDLPPIFAVVEASGRVLMGSKGVRSERMEVKALAFDYEHSHFSNALNWGTIDLDRIGKNYGVPVFSYISSMVEAFPQPDLSNLLKNQES